MRGNGRPQKQSVAFKPIQEAPFEMVEIAYLCTEKEAGSHSGSQSARHSKGRLAFPPGDESKIWLEVCGTNGFRLKQHVCGRKQFVRYPFLVSIEFELNPVGILSV